MTFVFAMINLKTSSIICIGGITLNTLHLKYAVEVEQTGSISKAAENLYMNQPHLSKTIRELEDSLGIVIFKRTPKGVIPTKKGTEFLIYAKKILAQLKEMESIYKPDTDKTQKLDISVPRASYISYAFTEFVRTLDHDTAISLNYMETNSMSIVKKVSEADSNLGIVRYQEMHEHYFMNLLREKKLKFQPVLDFVYLALMSAEHPLAQKEDVDYRDFAKYTQITHGDISIPALSPQRDPSDSDESRKEIAVYERGSQFELLSRIKDTYMWVSPMPAEVLKTFSLVQRKCPTAGNRQKDILIYRAGYRFSSEDETFIKKLHEVVNSL